MTKSLGSIFVTAMVSVNFVTALWHLYIVQKMYPAEQGGEIYLLGPVVGTVSLLAILLIWTRFYKVGAWISAGLLLVGFTVGSYEHFVSVNPNNVFLMPHGNWTLSFQISVALLVIVELLGIWASLRTAMLGGVRNFA